MTNVAAALIWQGDKFLICRRPLYKARGGLWEFVGGKQEPGETLPQTLIRECREELDITVSVEEIFLEVPHHYPDIDILLTLFHCKVESGDMKLLEHIDARYISPSEIDQYDFCPADVSILAKIKECYGN